MNTLIIKKAYSDAIYNYYNVLSENINYFAILSDNLIEYVYLHNINILNNKLIIEGYLEVEEKEKIYACDLYLGNKDKTEKLSSKEHYGLFILNIDDKGYFYIEIDIPFIYNFFATNFYIKFYEIANNLVNINKIKPLKIFINNEISNLFLNNAVKNTIFDEIIFPYFSYGNRADARILSIVRRLKRDKRVYMNSRYANTHKWLLLSIKTQGIKCNYCNIDYEEYYSKLLDAEETIEFYDTKAVQNICYYCLGTGFVGAYDYIGYIDAFLQYSIIYDGEAGLINVGTGFSTSDYPIKIRDYLFGYNTLFIIDSAIEVRQFLNYPILYKFQITSLPFNNIMNNVIKNIVNNMEKFNVLKKYVF